MARKNFKVGQQIIVKRNLGGRGMYADGMTLREVPLGSVGIVRDHCRDYDGDEYGVQFMDKEFYFSEEEIEAYGRKARQKGQEKFNSALEDALLCREPTAKKDSSGPKPFKPKFNKKSEFVAWIREEFPKLTQYARRGGNYKGLVQRSDEVQEAALIAWKEVKKSKDEYGDRLYCHTDFVRPLYRKLSNFGKHKQEKSTKEYAKALERFVRALDQSVKENFPYTSAAQDILESVHREDNKYDI